MIDESGKNTETHPKAFGPHMRTPARAGNRAVLPTRPVSSSYFSAPHPRARGGRDDDRHFRRGEDNDGDAPWKDRPQLLRAIQTHRF